MGSVTKTIMEGVGDVTKSTSYHFSSFEDFMEYERVVNDVSATRDVSVTTTKSPLTKLEVGKQYRITKNLHGHEFDIGTVVVVAKDVDPDGDYRADLLDGSDHWYIKPEEVEEV